ncbi:MAG: hypothetical protein R2712_11160 [Vicinamibacterales bacterium]
MLAALDGTPGRIPVVLGGCGTGRTTLLHALADRLGRGACQYLDIERSASTPERFHRAVSAVAATGPAAPQPEPTSAREAFDRTLRLLTRPAGDRPATFMLDEILELRTFESFPGLRHVLRETIDALAASGNRFVLTSRYVARAHKLLRDAGGRFDVIHLPSLSPDEVSGMLPPVGDSPDDRDFLGRTIQALTDGRAAYVRALGEASASMSSRGSDPISALTAPSPPMAP